MLSQKQFNILLILSMLCLLSSWLLWSNITHKNEDALKELSLFEQLRKSNEFNYINGLWMIPSGIMFITFLLILELPSENDVYKEIKKRITKQHIITIIALALLVSIIITFKFIGHDYYIEMEKEYFKMHPHHSWLKS